MKYRNYFIVFAVAMLFCTSCGKSDNKATTMCLIKTVGDVGVEDADGESVALMDNLGLYSGYGIGTESDSFAWINLDDTKLTKIDEKSKIKITKNGKDLELVVNSGSLFFNVTESLKDDESMGIHTSTMICGIRGTCGWIDAVGDASLYVLEGTVECIDEHGNTEKISRGQKARITNKIEIEQMEISDIPRFVLQEERPADGFGGNIHFVSWEDSGLEDHVMDWKDAELEEKMRQITGIRDGDIMLSDVWEITELTFMFGFIQDISALGELTNLTSLNLNNNKVENIDALRSLTNLTVLDLSWNQITDISALEELTNLMVLDLGDNYELTDINALSGLTNLTSLSLSSDYKVGDISNLSGLTNMQVLDLSGTGISDVSALGNMVDLTWLNLSFNPISDISALSNLVNLTYLHLAFTDITDYSPLDSIPNIDRTYY